MTEGIDSLFLNPDSQLKTMLAIVDVEKRLAKVRQRLQEKRRRRQRPG